VTDASNKWNALLADNTLWTQKGKIAPKYKVQNGRCPAAGPNGFNIDVWATTPQFKSDFCRTQNPTCCSAAIPAQRTFFLGPWNRDTPVDLYDPFTALHEYGHLLGLGDTYRTPGVNEWVGQQPASVMNGLTHTLAADDKLGLWAVVRALKTGKR